MPKTKQFNTGRRMDILIYNRSMSTQPESVEFILEHLYPRSVFSTRAMFGEYALYAEGKVVGLICDDMLYVKITNESKELEEICEKHPPYKGASLYYLVEESQLPQLKNLSDILLDIAEGLPEKKSKKK